MAATEHRDSDREVPQPMTSFNAGSYQIERTTGVCQVTGRKLEPGETYVAVLIEQGDALERVDLSLEAWERGEGPEPIFSFWKTTAPDEKKPLFVDDEVLMNLLRRLADAEQPQRIAFRFVLMLILMRKKLLRYDRTETRTVTDAAGHAVEQQWWILTPKLDLTKGPMGKWNESETLEVLDPQIGEPEIREVTEQLGQILNAELEA
jgi:hypothetical protein